VDKKQALYCYINMDLLSIPAGSGATNFYPVRRFWENHIPHPDPNPGFVGSASKCSG